MKIYMKYGLLIAIFLFILIKIYSDNPKITNFQKNQTTIYKAFIQGDMSLWKRTIDSLELITNINREYPSLIELVNFQYGYIAWCIGHNKTNDAELYLTKAKNIIKVLEEKKIHQSITNTYKATFYGFEIYLNNLKAPFLISNCMECANIALKLDPNNPFAYIENGNIIRYLPKIAGGSKEKALSFYLKAEKLMEKDSKYLKNNWNYINLLLSIAQTYTELNQFNQAKKYYEKILIIEPHFLWVKTKLYPSLLKKIKQNNL